MLSVSQNMKNSPEELNIRSVHVGGRQPSIGPDAKRKPGMPGIFQKRNLVAKNITPVRNEVLLFVMKCIDYIKSNAKCERIFRQFCEKENAGYVRLLLYTKQNVALVLAVNDLLSKKRNRLDIIKRGDLRLKLTKLEPDIKSPSRRHDASGSE
ncbi:SCAN domain-containing protein 3 [Trichonephila clavipes]|nr:SCAN domain-containing protein 3 [Trichonephila clavipes]